MTTTLLSSHHPGLYCHDVDVCFTCLPQLSTSLNDDAVCPSYDVCSLLSVDVIQPQMSTFQVTASTSLWSSDSTGPQHVVVDNQHALGDETSSSGHNIQMSVVNDASWPNSDELMSSSELDECLSHLLMTSQPGCHGNYNNVAADWQSELSAVNQLAEQIQPSQCDVDRLHVATSASLSDQESILHTSLRTEVKSPTFACHDTDSDEELPSKRSVHLWQFLKELLMCPTSYQNAIRWLDRYKGIFKIEDSAYVARLWGRRKNRPAMNYDKLSRSIRQYYRKGIIRKTDCSRRLVYQFCPKYL